MVSISRQQVLQSVKSAKANRSKVSPSQELLLQREKNLIKSGVQVGALAILNAFEHDRIPNYNVAKPNSKYQRLYVEFPDPIEKKGRSTLSTGGNIYIEANGEKFLLRKDVPIEVLVDKGYYQPPQTQRLQSPTIQTAKAAARIEKRKLAAPEAYK